MDENGVSRRSLLKAGLGLAGTASLAGCIFPPPSAITGGGPSLGGTPNAGGVGSGFAYKEPAITPQDAHRSVRTADQLVEAVQGGTPEQPVVIWIPADAAIDMSGRSTVTLENCILASSRHVNHKGAIIYTETYGEDTSQYAGGGIFDCHENVRITGLRIRGPFSNVYPDERYPGYIPMPDYDSKARRYEFYDAHAARGLTVSSGSVQIDNCELFGWSRMAVYVNCPRSYQRDREQSYPQFNNLSGHNNLMDSSGYVIEVIRGHAVIQQCYFNANRHSIANFGHPDAGFTISECFFDRIISSFPVDCHYLGENNGSGSSPDDYKYRYRGGEMLRVLNSTFACLEVFEDNVFAGGNPQPAIALQGVPLDGAVIQGNTFRHNHPDESGPNPFSQGYTPGDLERGPFGFVRWEVGENRFGWNPFNNSG